MEETNAPEKNAEKLSPEKAAEMRKNMVEYYQNQKSVLEAQLEFETKVAEIEEQRLRSLKARYQQAMMMAPPPEETILEEKRTEEPQQSNLEITDRPVRKLKEE